MEIEGSLIMVWLKVKAISAKRGQLSRSKASIEVQTSNQQVVRADSPSQDPEFPSQVPHHLLKCPEHCGFDFL